jgi:type VI secretion system secreted protein Hcp
MFLAGSAWPVEFQYLFIQGQKSGEIKGSVVAKGEEGSILVDSVSHEIAIPLGAQTGSAAAKRQHKPFVVDVQVDRAWAPLYNLLATAEPLPKVELRVAAPDASKTMTIQRKVLLTNASIAGIRQFTVNGSNGKPDHDELRISFTYQKIEWDWVEGAITAKDDWLAPAP